MHIQELNDPCAVEAIKGKLRDIRLVGSLTEVRIGDHPELGTLVLIVTDSGSVLVTDDETGEGVGFIEDGDARG